VTVAPPGRSDGLVLGNETKQSAKGRKEDGSRSKTSLHDALDIDYPARDGMNPNTQQLRVVGRGNAASGKNGALLVIRSVTREVREITFENRWLY